MKLIPAAVCAALSICFGAPAFARTFSLAGDWNGIDNPNGVWSYGFRDGSNTFVSFGTGGGNSGYGGGFLAINRNNGSSPGFGIDPGQVSLEADGGAPDARFIAPTSGFYDIELAIGGTQDSEGGGFGNRDTQNGVLLINGTSVPGNYDPTSNVLSWSLTQSLSAGDIADAYVGAGFIGGNTQTIFTIAQAPEPASVLLLTLPFLTLASRSRRAK